MLSNLYRSLSKLHHFHVENVLAFGQQPQSEALFIARSWEHGLSLDELIDIQLGQPFMWFTQLLTGLQYMHQMDIYHGAICAKNIICNQEKTFDTCMKVLNFELDVSQGINYLEAFDVVDNLIKRGIAFYFINI